MPSVAEETKQKRVCKRCGSNKTFFYKKRNYEVWCKIDGDWHCRACYNIAKGYAKRVWDKSNAKRNRLRLAFLGKRVVLWFEIRKHVCEMCGQVGYTHCHHEVYWPIMIWVGIREMCPKHHGIRSNELDQLKMYKKRKRVAVT